MPTLQLIITDAGRQAIVDETNAGTLPVTLTEIAVGTGTWSPDATATALQAELKRITAVGGLAVAPDTIHITCTDDSTDAYALGEFGIYTDGGVLFAIYSDPLGITDKAADALLLLAADAVLTSVPPGSVTVNGVGFSNPPATESAPGVAEVATQAEALAGTDDQRIVTPLKLAAVLAALVDSAPATLDTLNELAAALGDDPNFATTMTNALAGKQPLAATLTALAAISTVADKLIYASGPDTFSTTTLSAFIRTLLDDGNAATARNTLGAAPLASPIFTGTPAAPTPAPGDNTTKLSTTAFVQAAIAALVDSSPGTLDTLNELAAALGDDPNFATTMTNALAGKQPLDATLTALAALATAADKLIYATDADQFATTTLTAFARSLLDDVNGEGAQTTLRININDVDFSTPLSDSKFPAGVSRFYKDTGGSLTGDWMTCITIKSSATRGFQIAVDDIDSSIIGWRNTASDGLSWQPWNTLFHARNILGTVSQSSGIPTGAIIERGSNANGEYVRFADGTQICTFTGLANPANLTAGSIFKSSSLTWTFPAAFIANPTVSGASESINRWVDAYGATAATALVTQFTHTSSAASINAQLMAIGRWF